MIHALVPALLILVPFLWQQWWESCKPSSWNRKIKAAK